MVFGKKEKADVPAEPKPAPVKEPKEPKIPEFKHDDPKLPKGFREELTRVKGELQKREEAIASLESRIAEAEARGKDTTALTERLAEREKELENVRADLRAAKSEVSDEFKAKWEKPFSVAADYAKRIVEGMVVNGVENADGTTTQPRAATWNDFVSLYKLPLAQASKQARTMFGEDGQLIIGQVLKLQDLEHQRVTALEEEKASWKQRETEAHAEQVKQREAFTSARETVRKALTEKYPDLYAEDPNDPEGNAILLKTRELINKKPATFQESVNLYVRNQLNAEAAPRLAYRLSKVRAELEAAKSTIEEMKKSRPGPGSRSTASAPPTAEPEDQFAGLEAAFNQ